MSIKSFILIKIRMTFARFKSRSKHIRVHHFLELRFNDKKLILRQSTHQYNHTDVYVAITWPKEMKNYAETKQLFTKFTKTKKP